MNNIRKKHWRGCSVAQHTTPPPSLPLRRRNVLWLFLCVVFLSSCAKIPSPNSMPAYSSSSAHVSSESAQTGLPTQRIVLSSSDRRQNITLTVEIAGDGASRERGLMLRDHLESDAGMLFIFDRPQILNFWMKNTIIPLDVLFFDDDGRFVSASTMVPCTGDPCAVYPSSGPALYALEVTEGFVTEHGVGEGWELRR